MKNRKKKSVPGSIPYKKQEKSISCLKQNLANGTGGILSSSCSAIL
jgi:hypothetical protein